MDMNRGLVAGALVLLVAVIIFFTMTYQEGSGTGQGPVEIVPIEHASAVLKWGDVALYTDPVGGAEKFEGQTPPTIILLTDIHGDHLSTSTLSAIAGSSTIVAPKAVADQLPDPLKTRVVVLANGESTTQEGIRIEAVPMYNLPEAENANFHTEGRGNGYLLEKDGFRVYIAGDTAGTPEMRALKDIDIALIPMNLPYTMSVEEAAEATLAFKPAQVIPYHYRQPDGFADVEKFKQLVNAGDQNIEVLLLPWYPQ